MAGLYPHPRNGANDHTPQHMAGFLDKSKLYGTMVRPTGLFTVYKADITTGNLLSTMDIHTILSNTLEEPLFDGTDDHYEPTCAVDDQDNFHLWANHHDGLSTPSATPHYVKCVDVANWSTPASWVIPTDNEPGAALDHEPAASGIAGGTYTYEVLDRLTDGTLLFWQSQSPGRNDSAGRCWLAWTKKAGGNWTPMLGGGAVANTNVNAPGRFGYAESKSYEGAIQGTDPNRIYCNGGLIIEPKIGFDFVHMYGCFRMDSLDPDSQQCPWYLRADSRDLTKWYAADGTLYAGQTTTNATVYASSTPMMPLHWNNKAHAQISSIFCANMCQGIYLQPGTGTPTTPSFPSICVRNGKSTLTGGDGTEAIHPNIRFSWNGSSWAIDYPPAIGGQIREFNLTNGHWWRTNTSQERVAFRQFGGSLVANIGGRVQTAGNVFSANPCPITLREAGVYIAQVPDGSTPKLFFFPQLAKA